MTKATNNNNNKQKRQWTTRTNNDKGRRQTMTTATNNNEDKQQQQWAMQFSCLWQKCEPPLKFLCMQYEFAISKVPTTQPWCLPLFSNSKGPHNSRLMPKLLGKWCILLGMISAPVVALNAHLYLEPCPNIYRHFQTCMWTILHT
jgi:hypothetical protein